jgi:hypothetical protein
MHRLQLGDTLGCAGLSNRLQWEAPKLVSVDATDPGFITVHFSRKFKSCQLDCVTSLQRPTFRGRHLHRLRPAKPQVSRWLRRFSTPLPYEHEIIIRHQIIHDRF